MMDRSWFRFRSCTLRSTEHVHEGTWKRNKISPKMILKGTWTGGGLTETTGGRNGGCHLRGHLCHHRPRVLHLWLLQGCGEHLCHQLGRQQLLLLLLHHCCVPIAVVVRQQRLEQFGEGGRSGGRETVGLAIVQHAHHQRRVGLRCRRRRKSAEFAHCLLKVGNRDNSTFRNKSEIDGGYRDSGKTRDLEFEEARQKADHLILSDLIHLWH